MLFRIFFFFFFFSLFVDSNSYQVSCFVSFRCIFGVVNILYLLHLCFFWLTKFNFIYISASIYNNVTIDTMVVSEFQYFKLTVPCSVVPCKLLSAISDINHKHSIGGPCGQNVSPTRFHDFIL